MAVMSTTAHNNLYNMIIRFHGYGFSLVWCIATREVYIIDAINEISGVSAPADICHRRGCADFAPSLLIMDRSGISGGIKEVTGLEKELV